MSMRKLKLRSIDPSTECTVETRLFSLFDVKDLSDIIDVDEEDNNLEFSYELEPAEVFEICKRFSLSDFDHSFPVELSPAHPVDELPYVIHTGRELRMMIAGVKPLASFSESLPRHGVYRIPEHLFDPYVDDGLFLKREYCRTSTRSGRKGLEAYGSREVLYALRNEEWRFDAFITVHNAASKDGWGVVIERIVGSLLGYKDWEIDIYLEYLGLY